MSTLPRRVAVVDDDWDLAQSLCEILRGGGYVTACAANAQEARRIAGEVTPQVALVDIHLGSESGIELVSSLRESFPDIACIVITAHAEWDSAVEALHVGAYDCLRKPLAAPELLAAVERAFQALELRRDRDRALQDLESRNRELRGISASLRNMFGSVQDLAASPSVRALLETLLDRSVRHLSAGGGCIYLSRGTDYHREISIGPRDLPEVLPGEGTSGPVGRCLAGGHPVRVRGSLFEPLPQPYPAGPGYLLMPVRPRDGGTAGLVVVYREVPFTFREGSVGGLLVSTASAALRAVESAEEARRSNEQLRSAVGLLRSSEARFRALAEQSLVGIAILKHGRIDYTNGTFQRTSGYEALELQKRSAGWCLHAVFAADRAQARLFGRNPERRSPSRVRVQNRAGDLRWVELWGKRLTIDGEPPAFMIIMADITDLKRAEDLAAEHERRIMRMEKLASLGVLVSGVAHEINNPNQAILSSGEIVRHAVSDLLPYVDELSREGRDLRVGGASYEEMREDLSAACRSIGENARRIDTIVKDLRQYAREDSPEMGTTVDPNSVVQSALRLAAGSIRKSTNAFSVSLAPGVPLIRGSFQRLEQVMINLVQNACQALDGPERAVRVSTVVDKVHAAVLLTVEDEGCGIRPEDLPHVVDPFFTTKRDSGGMGLGLAVSDSIVREHGGTLTFRSVPGRGTVAVVSLPAGSAVANQGGR